MLILIKKAFRDLSRSRLRSISIILAIALSVGLGIGLVNATKDAFESFDRRMEVTNYEDIDIHIELDDIDLRSIESIEGVETAVGRLMFRVQVRIGEDRYKAHWISAPYQETKPYSPINGYQITKGDYMGSKNSAQCLIGNLFADSNSLSPGDALQIFYENRTIDLSVSGVAASPEYIYVVGDAGWPEPSLLLPLFTTYEFTASALNISDGHYNEILVRVTDGYDPAEVKEKIESYLSESGHRITRSQLGTEEVDYLFSRTDANAMGQMGWVFGIIILLVTAVVIYNSLSKLISSQRAYIGVMGALGGRGREIVAHYCLFGFFLGSVGSIMGIPLGIGMSYLTVYGYADIIGLIDPVYTIFWIYPAAFSIIGITISTLAALFGSMKAVRIGPREALTSQYQAQDYRKKPVIERIFDLVARKRPVFSRIPLRNLARHKIRTGITMLSLALSLLLVFSCLSLALGFTQPLRKNYDEYETWDLKAMITGNVSSGEALSIIQGDELAGLDIEISYDHFTPILIDSGLEYARFQAFQTDSDLRNFHVIDGKKDFDEGILIGSILAKNLDLKVGSPVTFVIGNITSSTKITGITGELMDDSFLMTLEQAERLLYTGGLINSLIIDLNGMDKEEAESLIRDNFPIAEFAYTEDVINGMEGMMEGLIGMFTIFIIFGIVAEVLFISTTIILNILDREMEFISLRAIGANPLKIRRLIATETLILLSGSLIIGLPLGIFTTRWAMSYIAGDMMYYVLEVPISVFIITALLAGISAMGSSFISARHITGVKLHDAIRNRNVT
ncbi:MAG: ABC transporter permease [Thermoplasmatota archaeon]